MSPKPGVKSTNDDLLQFSTKDSNNNSKVGQGQSLLKRAALLQAGQGGS
jgi:hypothetical protein